MRCPAEKTWHQGRGPSDPRRGTIHQCVLESGHPGPCAMEPTGRVSPGYVREPVKDALIEAVLVDRPPRVWTREEIAQADARYRDALRAKRAR